MRVGTIVRVPLHGRRVRGWVVADDVEPEARRSELRPLAKVVSAGPPAEVVELCRWAAWRYAGPFPLLLRSASPPNVVPPSADPELHTAVFPPREAPDGIDAAAVDALVTRDRGLLAWPPSAEWHDVVGTLIANEASTIVVAPDSRRVRALVDDLRRCGREVIVVRGNEPDARRSDNWNRARSGATVVVGGRVAVLAPVPDLAAVLVLDDGDEALKEERAPTWNARDLALERARRAGGRCTLVSPAPTLEAEAAAGAPARPTRPFERDAWPRFEVVDLRDEPPGRGLFSDALTTALHATVDRGARAACVVNRKGRAQLLVCRQCGHIAQCEVCDAAVAETEGGLVCRRCGTERPRVCLHCHSTRFARRRPGVTRVREEMAALLPRATVAEVDAATAALPSAGVLVGTEAVLHRADAAPSGIELVAFLEFDQELLATRVPSGRTGALAARPRRPRRRRETWRRARAGADPGARSRRDRRRARSRPDDRRRRRARPATHPRIPALRGARRGERRARRGGRRVCGAAREFAHCGSWDPSRPGRRHGRSSRRNLPTCSATRSPRSISPPPASTVACASTSTPSGSEWLSGLQKAAGTLQRRRSASPTGAAKPELATATKEIMATHPVRLFGDPVLKQRSREVEDLNGSLVGLAESMYETMYEALGLGLAAPQIGVQRRIFTYDVGEGPHVVMNPEIVEASGEWVYNEGCLSVPGMHFEIVRPKLVTLRGVGLDGNDVLIEADEVLARLFQHEIDHLDGVLLLDRLEPDERKRALRALREQDLATIPRGAGPAL